jgi:hypothetical protein
MQFPIKLIIITNKIKMYIDIGAVKNKINGIGAIYNTARQSHINTDRYQIDKHHGSKLRNSELKYHGRNTRMFPVEESIDKCNNCQGLASA